MANLGKAIRQLREDRQMSVRELGANLFPRLAKSTARCNMYQIENNKRTLKDPELTRISDLLGVSVERLLSLAAAAQPYPPKNLPPRICAGCEKMFHPTAANQKFCTNKCRYDAWWKSEGEQRRSNRHPRGRTPEEIERPERDDILTCKQLRTLSPEKFGVVVTEILQGSRKLFRCRLAAAEGIITPNV